MTQAATRLETLGLGNVSREDLERAYDVMHTALEEIVEGGPWRCVNRAEEALEDLWEIIKEDGHG
jgi:hypothetical protein